MQLPVFVPLNKQVQVHFVNLPALISTSEIVKPAENFNES